MDDSADDSHRSSDSFHTVTRVNRYAEFNALILHRGWNTRFIWPKLCLELLVNLLGGSENPLPSW